MNDFTPVANPSRLNKAPLLSEYIKLAAAFEAMKSRAIGETEARVSVERRCDELQRAALASPRASTHQARIATLRELGVRQRELSAAGVPCVIQGGVLRHQFTRAIIE